MKMDATVAFSGGRNSVCGASEIKSSWVAVYRLVGRYPHREHVLVGDCPTGIDEIIRRWFQIDIEDNNCFKADWEKHGKAAGPIRNKEMIDDSDMLIAFWDGKSRGTKNCIECATNKGIPVLIMPTLNRTRGDRYG